MDNREACLREARRLEDMRAAGDPYSAAIHATRMPIVVSDARIEDVPIVFANEAFLALTGYARDEIVGRNCRFLQGPETDRAEVARISAAIAAGAHVEAEILNYRKDGSTFWNALFISPVTDPTGRITHFFGSQVDMTARRSAAADLAQAKDDAETLVEARTRDLRRALEQKTLLLHEVDHRVKNNLQLISSLIQLQSRRIPNPEIQAVMKAMLNRVSALSSAHRHLFQADDAASFDVSAFVRDMASDLVEGAGRDDIRLSFDLAPATAPAAKASAISLVVSELVTNALAHAFPDNGGELRCAIRRDGSGFVIEVADDGVGLPGHAKDGFGLTLVGLLGRQLSADVQRSDAGPGLKVRIALPADDGAAS